MKKLTTILGIFCLCFSTCVFAAESPVQVHIGDLSPEDQAVLAELQMKAAESATARVRVEQISDVAEEVKKYANIGAEVGNAVGEAIVTLVDRLGVEVNEFIQSPAGGWTIAIIILYLFGGSLWTLTVGTTVWLVLMTGIWKLAKRFVIPIRIEKYEGEGKDRRLSDIEFVKPYNFKTDDARTTAFWMLGIAATVFTVVWFFKVI